MLIIVSIITFIKLISIFVIKCYIKCHAYFKCYYDIAKDIVWESLKLKSCFAFFQNCSNLCVFQILTTNFPLFSSELF